MTSPNHRMCLRNAGAYTFQITITKTYNVTNLFEDLKTLYKMAGLKGRKVLGSASYLPAKVVSSTTGVGLFV